MAVDAALVDEGVVLEGDPALAQGVDGGLHVVDGEVEDDELRRDVRVAIRVGDDVPVAGTVVGEELITQERLQGSSKADAQRRLAEVAPSLALDGLERRSIAELSGGQRRRFDVALGLMHTPSVVFLDEPTTGLDPQSRANQWEHIRRLREEEGVTILLTTTTSTRRTRSPTASSSWTTGGSSPTTPPTP